MKKLSLRLAIPLVCLILLANTSRADAQIPVSGKQAAGIFAVLIGAGVGVGVGIYFLVRAPRNITGCVSDAGGDLQLTDEKAMNRYLLVGQIAALKPSERVRLSGKPGKNANKKRTFSVKKVSKNYGPCNLASTLP